LNPTIHRLLTYCHPHARPLWLGLCLLLLATLAEVGGPMLIKLFVDDYLAPGRWDLASSLWLGAGYLALQGLSALGFYLQSLQFSRVAQAIVQHIREQVFTCALHLPAPYLDSHKTGSLISTITNDTEALMNLYVQVIGQFVQKCVLLLGIFGAMALLDWQLCLVALMLLLGALAIMRVYQRLSVPIVRATRSLLSDINGRLNESLQGMTVIQTLGQETRFAEAFDSVNRAHWQARQRGLRLNGLLLRPLIDLLHMLVLIGLLGLFGLKGSLLIPVGVIYAFVSYLGRMVEPINAMTNQLSQLQQAMVAGERVFGLMDEPREPTGGQAPTLSGGLSFETVSFGYQSGHQVLREVSFSVAPGHMLAIVGHTGSGKSTLVSLLMGFYPPDTGQILLDGQPLANLELTNLRRQIGLVQQDPFIFAGTLAENVRLGRTQLSEADIWKALEQVQLGELVRASPLGLETPMEEGGRNLSAGQRQLLSFARALAGQPRILILDEATASVDSQTEVLLQRALEGIRQRYTLIAVAHRLSTIVQADEIILLAQGRVLERGRHEELLALGQHYATLYQLQQQHPWLEAV